MGFNLVTLITPDGRYISRPEDPDIKREINTHLNNSKKKNAELILECVWKTKGKTTLALLTDGKCSTTEESFEGGKLICNHTEDFYDSMEAASEAWIKFIISHRTV